MTMPSDYVPKHCRHKAKNRGFVRFPGDPRPIYTGRWGSEEANGEYDRLIAEWLAQGRRIPDAASTPSGYLVRDLVADYLEAFDADHVGSRQPEMLRLAVKPLLRMWGSHEANGFRPSDLKALRHYLIEANLSRTTINQRITMLKAMFRWGVEDEHVHPDVAAALAAVKNLTRSSAGVKQPRVVEPVPPEHVDAVLAHVAPPLAAMIQVQRLTGMRPGEVLIMRGADINRDSSPWIYKPTKHKNQWRRHERVIPLGPKAQAILVAFLESRLPAAFLFTPSESDAWHRAEKRKARKSKEPPSQVERRRKARSEPKAKFNDHYDVHTYRRAIERACKKAGVPVWTPHRLRHTAATEIERQCGWDAARAVLGHTTPDTTAIYVRRDVQIASDAMNRLG
jgi:integrase